MVQGKEKWKKVNKVRYLTERGHDISGVVPLEHDMCTNSCVAYTGPYSNLENCPCCAELRYIAGSTKPQKQFLMIPIGPVIQVFYSSSTISKQMHYLANRLADNVDMAFNSHSLLDIYDDTACGQELLDAWHTGCYELFLHKP